MKETLGRRLKRLRTLNRLSQRDLAFPGCTAVYICRIEHGERTPSLQVIRELARRLGVTTEYLETGTELPDPVDELYRVADDFQASVLDELRLRVAARSNGTGHGAVVAVGARDRKEGDQ